MPLNPAAWALASLWASGGTWEQVSREASRQRLADGDLYRCLRGTLEVLQALQQSRPLADYAHPLWRQRVGAAVAAVRRSPLSDNMALDEGEAVLELGARAVARVRAAPSAAAGG